MSTVGFTLTDHYLALAELTARYEKAMAELEKDRDEWKAMYVEQIRSTRRGG